MFRRSVDPSDSKVETGREREKRRKETGSVRSAFLRVVLSRQLLTQLIVTFILFVG